jgi:uncharacterized protein YndB with AHSA1/START domain
MNSIKVAQPVVRLERTIPAPPHVVYRAWLEPDIVRRWLAPGGLTVKRVEIDAREGGHYRIWQAESDSDVGGFDCELLELVPDQRIVFRWAFVGPERNSGPTFDSLLTITLRAAPGDATTLTLVHERLEALAAGMPRVAENVGRGWELVIEKFAVQASDLNLALAGLHAVVAEFLLAMDDAEATWTIPRAPGKWSPSQVVEHVARIMEESANVIDGVPSKFPTIPAFLRPIVRVLVFRRILRRKAFLRMKAIEAFDPADGPRTEAEGRGRVAAVLARFDQACRTQQASGENVASPIFGPVSVAAFAEFQALHVRHHLQQMSTAADGQTVS